MLGFFELFSKEQLSVTAFRGVSLMPQLKTAKPAGPRSTVPYFICFKGICFKCNTVTIDNLLASSLRDRVLGFRSKWLGISCQTVLFPAKVNQHNEPRLKLCKSHWHDLYVTLKWNDTTCMLLVSLMPPSTAVLLLSHNGPPPMSTLVPTCIWCCCSSCTRNLRETCSASLYQQLAQCNTNILLRT